MADLHGKVALVIGASRGVGRGIALGLGEAGATVYITGRTTQDGKLDEDFPYAQLGLDYGFTDIDGKQPKPLTLAEA